MTGRVVAKLTLATLAKSWWAIALRGAAAIIFGILALLMPDITLTALVFLFGAYALVEGVFAVVAALRRRPGERAWWAMLLQGLVSIAVGVVTFFMPDLTALALVYLIAAWALITGMLEIVAAIGLRKLIRGEWWLAVSGVLSGSFGIMLFVWPGAGALALVLWIGIFSIVLGMLLLLLAFRLRVLRDELRDALPHAA
jgi:uncharacterized membrane protein HdeD (DUF308 family)